MLTIHSDKHRLRAPKTELSEGELVSPLETPARAEQILARIREVGLGEVAAPAEHSLDLCNRLHDIAYIDFLQAVWKDWTAAGHGGEAMPLTWPQRQGVGAGARPEPPLRSPDIVARIGYHALSVDTSITGGTWEAARSSMDVALTAQERLAALPPSGAGRGVFALCRPPGHHATRDQYGGYCFLNNAALAAQAFLDQGARRTAVLDIDFHHGNGTQSLFYDRADVLVASIHGDPVESFPYFTGFADETGAGAGEGRNANYPLPAGTAYDRWGAALEDACRAIVAYAPEALVVSLGVDTFKNDPISSFALETEDYLRVGERIAGLNLPSLFVMEGGYAVKEIGVNTVNVLAGFEG